MKNPMFGNNISPNGATAPNDPLNDSYKRYKRGYNRFNLTRQFFTTERYADINPIEVLEGVEGDKIQFGNKHEVRSYTLKSPIMFDIYKKKTYFMVDNRAILPNSWERIYKLPNKGDDVDYQTNCISSILYDFYEFLRNLRESSDNIVFSADNNAHLFRILLLFESVFSNGSLISSLGCNLSSVLYFSESDTSTLPSLKSFDTVLEELYADLDYLFVKFPSLSDKYFADSQNPNYIPVSRRQMLDMMRTYSDFEFSPNIQRLNFDKIIKFFKRLYFRFNPGDEGFEDSLINLSRLIAYQLVCTQFYTRDSVDNIYTAPMFLDNAKSTIKRCIGMAYLGTVPNPITNYWPTYTYNGSQYDYDVFSNVVMDSISSSFLWKWLSSPYVTATPELFYAQRIREMYHYLHMIFFHRKSLRYGDYFVGAKTLPFAPADVHAEVTSNGVSALDITRSILMQRFANAVERVSNTWKDYLSGVMDGVAPPTPYEPRFLANSTSKVGGFEVENTAQDQGNIVTVLRSQNSNYVYELEVGEPCIIIGVSTYEIPRVYSRTVSPFFKHKDRFDMFNKFMQNIGDQPISQHERSAAFSSDKVFGYTPRHMEYKQRYPIASGGFVENLNGYAFITDNDQSGQNDIDFSVTATKINSNYIRNKNSEFDRFYSSLTGLSLSSYFHFIVKYDCICDARRQMEYSPSIL